MERCATEPGRCLSASSPRSTASGTAARIAFGAFEEHAPSKSDGGLMTGIVSGIAHVLTPELVEKISSAAELDRASGQLAIEAVVPAILSAIGNIARTPGGAWRLSRAIAAEPSDALANLAGNHEELTAFEVRGGSVLPALLGESLVRQVAWIVGSYTGIGERPARKLMVLLLPVILGVLGRAQRASGLDAEGLSHALASERQEIAAAMPAGLNALLTDDLDGEAGLRSSSSLRWPDSLSPRHRAMRGAGEDASGGEWSAWVLPVLVVLGFVRWYALIWWLLLPASPSRVAEAPRGGETITSQSVNNTRASFIAKAGDDWISISGYFKKAIYNRAGERLGTIEDVLIGTDGRLNAAVVAIDHDLGVGQKDIAVPFDALTGAAQLRPAAHLRHDTGCAPERSRFQGVAHRRAALDARPRGHAAALEILPPH